MLKLPRMRAELIDYLRQLASPESKWRDSGMPAELDEAIHFLFDDTPLAREPERALGHYLVNA